jgi:hypothetical protein
MAEIIARRNRNAITFEVNQRSFNGIQIGAKRILKNNFMLLGTTRSSSGQSPMQ